LEKLIFKIGAHCERGANKVKEGEFVLFLLRDILGAFSERKELNSRKSSKK